MKIELAPEIVGALITDNSNLSQDSVSKYLKANNIETEAKIAENSAKEVNICLPYYSWVPDGKATEMSDDKLGKAAGGGLVEGGFERLPYDPDRAEYRNYIQLEFNKALIGLGRYDLIDLTYDGDFNILHHASYNDVLQHIDRNPTNK